MELKRWGRMDLKYEWMDFVDYGVGGQYTGLITGKFEADRLSGSLRLVNIPANRPDNVNTTTVRGTLTTADGARVFLEMNGIGIAHQRRRRFVTSLLLRTGDPRHLWINQVFAVVEGILSEDDTAVCRIYSCEPDLAIEQPD